MEISSEYVVYHLVTVFAGNVNAKVAKLDVLMAVTVSTSSLNSIGRKQMPRLDNGHRHQILLTELQNPVVHIASPVTAGLALHLNKYPNSVGNTTRKNNKSYSRKRQIS